jgi:N-acetylneuraminate synthase
MDFKRVFIIGEIGINHSGNLCIAKKLIAAAHFAGADAVKFQKRDIDTVYTPEFLAEPRKSPWGNTQRAQKEGLEFGLDEYIEIDEYCKSLGIPWFASAWDLKSLAFLDAFDLPFNKIAGAMLSHKEFCEAVADQGKHTFISTGLSDEKTIQDRITLFDFMGCPYTLMHCIGAYPCPPAELRLQYLHWLEQYQKPIGYSGHEVGLTPTLAAVAMGAVVVERHLTLDRSSYGSDQAASIEPFGFKRLVDDIREIEAARGMGFEPRQIWDIEKPVAAKLKYWEV